MKLRSIFVGAVLSSFALVGCGATCQSVCRDLAECDPDSDPGDQEECEASCEIAEAQADALDCEPEFRDALNCLADAVEECSGFEGCEAEGEAFDACAEGG